MGEPVGGQIPRGTPDALVAHLSNEITAQVAAMMVWRSRVNFTAYFGPWAIAGAYLAFSKGRIEWPVDDAPLMWLLPALGILYLVVGVGCGSVEADSRSQCDDWRRLIVKIQTGEARLSDCDLVRPTHVVRNYFLVYVLMLCMFVVGVLVMMQLAPAAAPSTGS